MIENERKYSVQILRSDNTVMETHVIEGATNASVYMEERLKDCPDGYWGRISAVEVADE